MCKRHQQREMMPKWIKIQKLTCKFVFVLIELPSGVMKVIKEMPPDLDNMGEITEVQVLEEGEVFDVDAFLASIPKPGMTQPQCPRCFTEMTFGYILNQDGSKWEYCRCPMTRFGTNCYVACDKENLANYLRAMEEQTYPCYAKIPPEKFRCACNFSMVLAMPKSEKNPGRLYFKCLQKSCRLFQWINEPLKELALKILSQEFE